MLQTLTRAKISDAVSAPARRAGRVDVTNESFERALAVLESTVKERLGSPHGTLTDEAYATRITLAREVFDLLAPSVTKFLAVTRGEIPGDSVGHLGGREPLSFPHRFLKAHATRDLAPDRRSAADDVLETTFLLGLLTHLVVWQFPTRSQSERVDLDVLEQRWLVEALVADQQMKPLFRSGDFPSIDLFETHYRGVVEPRLKTPLGIGFWGKSKAASYFRNLFCAGWLLGMSYDLRTQESSE